MTIILRKLIPLVSILILTGINNAYSLELLFKGSWPENQKNSLSRLSQELWSQWNLQFGKTNLNSVTITKNLKGLAGRASGNHIQINGLINSSQIENTLVHELAHVYIEDKFNPRLVSYWFSEALAQSMTGDYARIVQQRNTFAFAAGAKNYLKKTNMAPMPGDKKFEAAMARLLSQQGAPEKILNLMKVSANKKGNDFENQVWKILSLPEKQIVTLPLDFLAIDSLTNEELITEGRVATQYPVGSTLKPAVFYQLPAVMNPVLSRQVPEWNCPNEDAVREWTWQEALILSCNGFFLDHEQRENLDWQKFFSFLGLKPKSFDMKQATGLFPGVELSLQQLIKIYKEINENAAGIIEELKNVPLKGTLANKPSSAWFVDREIALKSGTVRAIDSVPDHSWIIGVLPNPKVIVAIHGQGMSTAALLPELKKRIEKIYQMDLSPVHVQILGLVPSTALQWRCEDSKNKNFTEYGRYRCPSGPITLSFPNKFGKRQARQYWGQIEYRVNNEKSIAEKNPRAARARRGSNIELITSRRSYVARVLLSEFSRGRQETLKALAVAVKTNLKGNRHSNGSVCDTTHCQVFMAGAEENYHNLNNYLAVADSVKDLEVNENWIPFSLGGSKPWKKAIDENEVKNRLDKDTIKSLKIINKSVLVDKDSIPCETFRNKLALLSCPDKIFERDGQWIFSGKGEGHNMGINLITSDALAAQGKSAKEILTYFGIK